MGAVVLPPVLVETKGSSENRAEDFVNTRVPARSRSIRRCRAGCKIFPSLSSWHRAVLELERLLRCLRAAFFTAGDCCYDTQLSCPLVVMLALPLKRMYPLRRGVAV